MTGYREWWLAAIIAVAAVAAIYIGLIVSHLRGTLPGQAFWAIEPGEVPERARVGRHRRPVDWRERRAIVMAVIVVWLTAFTIAPSEVEVSA